jgi:hypothetical protein
VVLAVQELLDKVLQVEMELIIPLVAMLQVVVVVVLVRVVPVQEAMLQE